MAMQTSAFLLTFCLLTPLALAQQSSKPSDYDKVVEAHGILASVAWVIFFPLGAVLIRAAPPTRSSFSPTSPLTLHYVTQICGILLFLSAFGMGLWMAIESGQLQNAHPIIGIVILGFMLVQPILGILAHLENKRKSMGRGRIAGLAYVHVWLGRALITLGMINGGLGLRLSGDSSTGERIAYGVVVGVVWVTWVGVVTGISMRAWRRRSLGQGSRQKRGGQERW